MQRSATRTGPGISRSPSAQRRTVRASTSSAEAASIWLKPSAAIASRNCSGVTEHGRASNAEAGTYEDSRDLGRVLILREAVAQCAIAAEQRQALRPIRANRDETYGIGGKIGGDRWFAHAQKIGPMARCVNGEIA